MTVSQQIDLEPVTCRSQVDDLATLIESGVDISVSDIVEFLNENNK